MKKLKDLLDKEETIYTLDSKGFITIKENLYLTYSKNIDCSKLAKVEGGLDLYNSNITLLPELTEVGGDLDLENSAITSLPKLAKVGGFLNLKNSVITSLPKLTKVWGWFSLYNSAITSLPKLAKVGNIIYLKNSKLLNSKVFITKMILLGNTFDKESKVLI